MDFNIRLLEAIRAINTSIQKTSVYVTQNTYAFGDASAIETAGVAAVLGDITGIWTNRVTVDGVATVSGILSVSTEVIGSLAGASGADAVLDAQNELISSAVSASGVDGVLNVATELIADTAGASTAEGAMTVMWTETAQGTIDGVAGADAVLDSQPGLVGSTAAAGQCGAMLEGIA